MKETKLTPGSNIFWSSSRMMIPQHVEAIKEYSRNSKAKTMPHLDEQLLQEFTQHIQQSYQERIFLNVTVFGKFEDVTYSGIVVSINQFNRKMNLELKDRDIISVHIQEIVNIEPL